MDFYISDDLHKKILVCFHSNNKLFIKGRGYFENEVQLLAFSKDLLAYLFVYHVILQIRTEVNEVTNVVATWRHQTKKFTSPTCPSLLSCSSSFILTFLAMEFLPQRSSQRSYQSLCNLSTETTHNGHVKEQDFGPLTSGPTRGVKRWS